MKNIYPFGFMTAMSLNQESRCRVFNRAIGIVRGMVEQQKHAFQYNREFYAGFIFYDFHQCHFVGDETAFVDFAKTAAEYEEKFTKFYPFPPNEEIKALQKKKKQTDFLATFFFIQTEYHEGDKFTDVSTFLIPISTDVAKIKGNAVYVFNPWFSDDIINSAFFRTLPSFKDRLVEMLDTKNKKEMCLLARDENKETLRLNVDTFDEFIEECESELAPRQLINRMEELRNKNIMVVRVRNYLKPYFLLIRYTKINGEYYFTAIPTPGDDSLGDIEYAVDDMGYYVLNFS